MYQKERKKLLIRKTIEIYSKSYKQMNYLYKYNLWLL